MRPLFFAVFALALAALPRADAAAFSTYSPAAFNQALASGKPVLVHVHADWCPVCARQIPVLNSLLADPALAGVVPIRVNFDRDREFLAKYGVRGQSTILVLKGGRVSSVSYYKTSPGEIRASILAGL